MKQSTKCKCGHMLMVHLQSCQVRTCNCTKFSEIQEKPTLNLEEISEEISYIIHNRAQEKQ